MTHQTKLLHAIPPPHIPSPNVVTLMHHNLTSGQLIIAIFGIYFSFLAQKAAMEVYDITNMMMGTYSGDEADNFGRDGTPCRCLLLDVVMPNRRRRSGCKLLQMPSEILAQVIDLMLDDKSSLSSLALVNSDCCYLARSGQFAEVRFNYSSRSRHLITHLAEETVKRRRGEVSLPAIGICMRRVTFASQPEFIASTHPALFDSIFGEGRDSYTGEQRDDLRNIANAHYEIMRKRSMLAISHAMPNLEMLAWEDSYIVDEEFFKAISRSTAQHLRLSRVMLNKVLLLEPPLIPDVWPLRSLDLDVLLDVTAPIPVQSGTSRDPRVRSIHRMSSFFGTMFQRCAPTLESLSWSHRDFMSFRSTTVSLNGYPLAFPSLRDLRLGISSVDAPTLSTMLVPSLKHLELPSFNLDDLGSCLAASEALQDLESLVIPFLRQPCDDLVMFINKHTFVYKLSIQDSGAPGGQRLDSRIMPMLADGMFSNISCLSLVWGEYKDNDRPQNALISETALQTIGTLQTLERLHLGAGCRDGLESQWLIDHHAIRQSLTALKKLKVLALERDTYRISANPSLPPEKYYSMRLVGNRERTLAAMRSDIDMNVANTEQRVRSEDDEDYDDEDDDEYIEIWEKAHRNRMLTEAEAYGVLFPRLEWLYCGQRPIGFSEYVAGSSVIRKAIPLTADRDGCYSFLKEIFE